MKKEAAVNLDTPERGLFFSQHHNSMDGRKEEEKREEEFKEVRKENCYLLFQWLNEILFSSTFPYVSLLGGCCS